MDTTAPGRLILAANSLGNDLDIPKRTLEAAHNADLIIFEDARVGRQVLKNAGLHRDFLIYSEHQEASTLEEVVAALQQGKTVLYVSDQGTPNFADPGLKLVDQAFQLQAKLEIIPGPSSVAAALAACPFPHEKFYYYGFLPREENKRVSELKKIDSLNFVTVILDTPYRLAQVLRSCAGSIDRKKQILLALDISGSDEQYLLLQPDDCEVIASKLAKKLNFVLIISSE